MKPGLDLLATVTRNRKCGDPHCHARLSRITHASSDGCYPTVGEARSKARAGKLAICARVATFPGQNGAGPSHNQQRCWPLPEHRYLPRGYCRPYRNTPPT